MKKLMTLAAVVFALLFSADYVSAQTSIDFTNSRYAAYGKDAASREKNFMNYNFFNVNMKSQNYEEAYKVLDEILVNSPAAHENLYINARTLLVYKIENAKTPEEREMLVDKLIHVHDLRNQYYGKVASRGSKVILSAKVLDQIEYSPKKIEKALAFADAAIKASGKDVDVDMLTRFLNFVSFKYMSEELSADVFINQYDIVANAVENSVHENKAEAQKLCEAILVQSGVADCGNIEKIYKPKFMAAKDDINLLKKILGYMTSGNCTGAFKNEVAEQYYVVSPSSSSAYLLAQEFERSGDKAKSMKYYEEAVKMETDPIAKSKFELRLAITHLVDGSAQSAAKYAKDAISHDSQNGLAYSILAQAYGVGSSKTGCTGIAQKTIYWLIEDVLIKARTLLADDAEQVEKINQSIRTYAPHFPTAEDIFFDSSLKEGASYNVNCGWINGTTRVRSAR